MLWFILLVCIFLLPFFLPSLCGAITFSLYSVLLICLYFLALKAKDYFKKDRFVLIPLFGFLAIIIATSFFAAYPVEALKSAFYICFSAIVFIFIAGLDTQKKRKIGLVLIAASFFISAVALLQRFFYFDKVIPYLISQRPFLMSHEFFYLLDIIRAKRVISVFPTPNLLASYIAMINLLILGYLFSESNKKNMFFFTFLLLINSYCLWLTRSFMGNLSFFTGGLLFILILFFKEREKFKRYIPFFVILLFILSVMAITLFIERSSGKVCRYNLSFALDERIRLWKIALAIIADKPLSFVGLGNFGNICKSYIVASSPESAMAHNILLQLWIEAGIYAVLVFTWFLLTLIYCAIKGIFKANTAFSSSILQAGVLSAAVAFLLYNMAGFSFFVPQVALIWWILCALLVNNNQDA